MYNPIFNVSSIRTRLDAQSMEINLLVVQSLQFVITNFFVKSSSSLVITISCRNSAVFNFYRLVMEHLFRNMNDTMTIQLVLLQNGNPEYIAGPRYNNLYLVDSLQSFLDIDPIQYSSNYNTNEFNYVFLQQRDEFLSHDIQGILNYCWQNQIINCNVQTQNALGRILVFTYFPYSSSKYCGHVYPKVINEFIGGIQMMHSNIFPKKLLNMHRCKLRVVTWSNPPFMKLHTLPNGSVQVGGFEGNLIKQLAQYLNFTIEIVEAINATSLPPVESELTVTRLIEAALEKLKHRTADINLGYVRANTARNQLVTSLFGHYQEPQVFCTLRTAQQYSSLEILGFPFRRSTWLIIILLLLSFIICLRICYNWQESKSCKTTAQQINFLAVSLGLPIPNAKLPKRNFKRIFYIQWTLSSFIIRSVYTALLYDLFCTNLYRQPPNSLDELIRKNYNIVLNWDAYSGIKRITQFHEENFRMRVINAIEEAASFIYLEQNPQQKLAAMGARDILLDYVRKNEKAGLFHILPEVVMHQQLTIYLTKHSFLIDQLNEVLQRIEAMGFMVGWLRSELDVRYFHSTHLEAQRFIGQNELNGIYFIYGSLLCLAFMVFLIEVFRAK